jgi:hypothetical protein
MSEGDAVRQVLAPFMSALRHLHSLNVIHRDIKPENLLLNAAGELKVAGESSAGWPRLRRGVLDLLVSSGASRSSQYTSLASPPPLNPTTHNLHNPPDFGLSIDITRERPVTRVGTLDYMAPEVVVCPDKCSPPADPARPHHHYTHLVDAWAVGVLAYELTVGRAPFDAGNKRATIDQILNGQPAFPAWLSEQARHFISWSLTKDAKARPDIPQLAYHPWITGHAARRRPRIAPLRAAASAMDLQSLPGGGASGNHAHMEARHKAMVAGHVGAPTSGLPSSSDSADDEEHAAAALAALVAGGSDSSSGGGGGGRAAGGANVDGALSPFAVARLQRARLGAGGAPASTSESLRAYVHRCQSANNLESLAAAVLRQPPEPSNACFEPGGRFYGSKADAPAPQRPAPAPPAAAAASACAPLTSYKQQHHHHPLAERVISRDSASSVASGSGGSPKPSRVPTPPLPPPGAPARPPALQLVRMPSGGGAPTPLGHLPAADAPPPAPAASRSVSCGGHSSIGRPAAPPPGSPAGGGPAAGGAPITPELGAPPRLQLFASSAKCSPTHSVPLAPGCGVAAAQRGSGSGRASSVDSLGGDAAGAASSGSGSNDGSSYGSRADVGSSVSSGGSSARGPRTSGAPLSPPQPLSPPHLHLVRGVLEGAHFAASKAAAAVASVSAGAQPIARSMLQAAHLGGGGAAAGAPAAAGGGGAAAPGAAHAAGAAGQEPGGGMSWFTAQCANYFLKQK